jgi:hypothetical protein
MAIICISSNAKTVVRVELMLIRLEVLVVYALFLVVLVSIILSALLVFHLIFCFLTVVFHNVLSHTTLKTVPHASHVHLIVKSAHLQLSALNVRVDST